jgi:hypothetical protein
MFARRIHCVELRHCSAENARSSRNYSIWEATCLTVDPENYKLKTKSIDNGSSPGGDIAMVSSHAPKERTLLNLELSFLAKVVSQILLYISILKFGFECQ